MIAICQITQSASCHISSRCGDPAIHLTILPTMRVAVARESIIPATDQPRSCPCSPKPTCAAFSSPRSAADAAVAAQRALELPVRMGVATGEAELREGDYFGAVLNRAARVMAAGHGGQILVADSTAVLLSGVDLVDLGPRRLRDVSVHKFVSQRSVSSSTL